MELPPEIAAAASRAQEALSVSEQMMRMMRDYARLEAEHAQRLTALAQRMEECMLRVQRCASSGPDAPQAEPSVCVDAMDQVVTFLVRFSSMHRQLSECVEVDVLEDWARVVATHKERLVSPAAEIKDLHQQLSHPRVMDAALYLSTLNWGYTNFDNIAAAFFTIFQSITQEGWTFFANTLRFDDDGYPINPKDPTFWEGTVPRNNFDSLLWAIQTVFQVISGENWNSIMYDGIRGNGFAASLYFISLVMLGDFVLMSLFLALLLDNFDPPDEAESQQKSEGVMLLAQRMSTMKVVPINSTEEVHSELNRRPGLKLVVNALFEAIPAVLNVMFVCMLFYFIFSIVAVNYLKGALFSCQGDMFSSFSKEQTAFLTRPKLWSAMNDEEKSWFFNSTCTSAMQDATAVTSRVVCECWGASWDRVLPQHFDNVIAAMLTFFELSTTEGWADVMMAAVDARGIDMQPERDNNTLWVFFFVAFILIGSFFVVNLFVGIIIDNFNRMKAALGGDFMLTDEQKKWIEAQKAASRVGPIRKLRRPNHKIRGPVFDIVRHNRFEWFIMVCIIINTILMGSQYFGQPTVMINVVGQVNEVFAVIFTLEAFLKILAYSSSYFWDAWNRFDFFVVMGTLLSVVIEWLTGTSVRSLAMLVRVIRVTRIIRLVKASKSIRQILLTLYIALPGLSNITSILFLMMFIYATMGVQIFSKVALHGNIDQHANFQGFWTAFLFLLRAATGEAWNSCMHDFASNVTDCVDDPDYNASMCGFNDFEDCIPLNGCGTSLSYPYFLTFTLLVTYVMLNLTIAVILEGFSLSQEDEEPLIEPELLEEFQNKWADIDIEATGFIHVRRMRVLITLLEPPLGHPHVLADKGRFFQYMKSLRLPMYGSDVVHFKDVLLAMAREMVKETVAGDPGAISEIAPPAEDATSRLRLEFHVHQFFAICAIQRAVAEWLRTKRELEKHYMEEYMNKIKKPSGRPKKARDARVYTIG
ncbi:hypothetical protein ATCC90586_005759 [Pythium insidiosum]|nr:hypothetical protein ATCC90586_005759 [Pythium insidiosum]